MSYRAVPPSPCGELGGKDRQAFLSTKCPQEKLRKKEIRIGRIPRVATWSPFRRCGSSRLSRDCSGRVHSLAEAWEPSAFTCLRWASGGFHHRSNSSRSLMNWNQVVQRHLAGASENAQASFPLLSSGIGTQVALSGWAACESRRIAMFPRPLASNRSLSTSVGRGRSTRRSEEHLRFAHPAGVPSPVGHKKLLSVAQSRFRSKPSPFVAGQPLQVSRFRVYLVR